jgi:phosphoribosyl 1,2-cyclic phosphodiesterase/CheY-like chemotaxis protein
MKTVLLMDGDRSARQLLARSLKKHGWKVLQADDGEEGLALVDKHRPDAIVCDMLLPRCNGFQLSRQLRERTDETAKTPIVITSSSQYATDRFNSMEAGADGYLIKPVAFLELQNTLNQLLNPPDPSAEPAKANGGAAPLSTPAPLKDQSVRIKFWGVRGSIPTPGPATAFYGGNTTCVEVQADGELFILDAGTGIRPLGLELLSRFKGESVRLNVLITHTHWDHIQGFPFFIPAYNPKNQLRIYGFEGARKGLESTLSAQMESPYFPISMQQMPGNITIEELKGLSFKVGPVSVQAQYVNHPGICVGYRLTTSAGVIVFIPDNEPFTRLKQQSAKPGDDNTAALEYAHEQDVKLIEFIRGAEVLIMDSQYDAMEYPRHVGWGHTCVDDTVRIALEAGVKRLFLFHHDPGHDDTHVSHMVAWARKIATQHHGQLTVDAAREGLEVVLKPAEKK